jgi:curved DNA-binding protein
MEQPKDYYKVMGLSRDANEKDIKMAYRKLARKYHPDISKEPNAEEKFKELGEAYEVLKDPAKRTAYNNFGKQRQHEQQQQYSYNQHAQNDWQSAGIDPDILESIFGYGRQRQAPRSGEDYQANITLSLEEAYQGCTRQLSVPTQNSNQTLNVKIPAGVHYGQKIRLTGQGAPGSNNGPRGDIYLTVHFHRHPFYEVKEQDIYLTLPIAPWEAALGTSLKVPTLGGVVDLKIPAGSQAGQKLRLKGRGLPGKTVGDQFVLLKIMVPPAKTESAKKLYEQMAKEMAFNPRAEMGV